MTLLIALAYTMPVRGADDGAAEFERDVEPILAAFCYDCHGYGSQEGSVTLDEFASPAAALADRDLWRRVLHMVRADLMPPVEAERPSDEQLATLERWIKRRALAIDPAHPDPGRPTVRRLNRNEYRNTIRDLMGVDFDVATSFPPDDTGHGFDNMGDVLTLSPLLLEKYIAAAEEIVSRAVPTVDAIVDERRIAGGRFRKSPEEGDGSGGPLMLPYYDAANVGTSLRIRNAGLYELDLDVRAQETWVDGVSDLNRCRLTLRIDGQEIAAQEFARSDGQRFHLRGKIDLKRGQHEATLELEPLTPDEPRQRSLVLRIDALVVRGPVDEAHRVRPPNYARWFPQPVPADPAERRAYGRQLLEKFTLRAFRRPTDPATVDRLADLAEHVWQSPGETFESGVARAMAAALASPRFLFREEGYEPDPEAMYPWVDQYALASRLSYLLWSSMPDDELFRLAAVGTLRDNLPAQVERMLADKKSDEFIKNFAGQWLRARDVETWVVDARAVLARENPDPERDRLRNRFRRLARRDPERMTERQKEEFRRVREEFFRRFGELSRAELNGNVRRAMRRETEMHFEYVLRENRNLVELIDADYTFLNQALAEHYGIPGVKGEHMRRVELPAGNFRGGVLTQGTTLVVTSNPDRTSPAKRGLYLLENVLGTPPPPPPPDIPSLEQTEAELAGKSPTVRELLELHRADPLCSSCHNRMDPLGLALESFNPLGLYRLQERHQPIETAGELITGEEFADVRELKRLLANERRRDYFRCAIEKLLTYALGRGLDYYDVEAVDQILARVESHDGQTRQWLMG
ncbi:MAG TPA: DUF1592 domain-containing protein, partial [Lacipirellulaceae bacterium]|nr:DUF1592 domain-containing protein [Lacipirellulaceae bacterium]